MTVQTGYFENDVPGSYANIFFTIKCRYQCLGGEGGTGIGVATLPLSPFWGFWPEILPLTVDLLFPERDILSNLSYFSLPRVGNLTKKLYKSQMLDLSPSLCPPPPPPPLYIQTSNITCIKPCQWCANYVGIDWPGWAVPIFLIFFFFIYNGKIFFLRPFSNEKWLWACRSLRQTALLALFRLEL